MSILISGMEMPTGDNPITLFLYPDGKVVACGMLGPLGHYEAVSVPDHGGLIDKRKVVQTVYDYCHTVDGKYCGPDDVGELWDEMKAMPAIIPASEEGV